jgi:hypothetical protein
MAILIATRDSELEQRCRRAASAEHELELVTSAAALNERIAAREPTAVLIDSELLDKPLERQVGEIVNQAGAGARHRADARCSSKTRRSRFSRPARRAAAGAASTPTRCSRCSA